MDFMRKMVRGFNWNVRMGNDAIFSFWTPTDISRKEAVKELLNEANGDYGEVYTNKDIESVWRNKNIRR